MRPSAHLDSLVRHRVERIEAQGAVLEFVNDVEPIGAEPPNQIADYLEAIGDPTTARLFRARGPGGQSLSLGAASAWTASGCKIGYIAPATGSTVEGSEIQPATSLAADSDLVASAIKVTLDQFYVHSFPGLGEHSVLCEFAGRNQCGKEAEDVLFATAFQVVDRQSAGVNASPIFVGLKVDPDGLALKGRIICIRSSTDEWLTKVLQSQAFRSGLTLITQAQPILKPFLSLASQAVGAALDRSRNKLVLKFELGLDFSDNATALKLRHGSYVVVQSDDPHWSWKDWMLRQDTNSLTHRTLNVPPVANYFILGISKAHSERPNPKPIKVGTSRPAE